MPKSQRCVETMSALQSEQDQGAAHINLPNAVSRPWAADFGKKLEQATWRGPGALKSLVSAEVVLKILHKAGALLKAEPTLLEVLA